MQPSSGPGEQAANTEFDLDRFVRAQDAGGTYIGALEELRAGRKRSHWMWFVFPQIAGLGHSEVAQRFAISSLEEAIAYSRHPVLGPRLVEAACGILTAGAASGNSAEEMLGAIDALKLRSSMTLFHLAWPGRSEFGEVLSRFFDGRPDRATVERLPPVDRG